MAIKSYVAVFAALLTLAKCHFTFVRIAHNGEWQAPTRFIRNKTVPYNETYYAPGLGGYTRLYNFPSLYYDSPESVRCGRDNLAHAAATDVLKVNAGDELEFAHQRWEPDEWTDDMFYGCPNNEGTCDLRFGMDINHPGPVIAHLSKVPEGQDVQMYDGSGSWTKIYTLGFEYRMNLTTPIFWLAYNNQKTPVPRFNFKIPKETPAGQYLLRIDLVFAGMFSTAEVLGQMYPSCAQIEVSSSTTGSLPEGVKIPEVMSPDSPGMKTSLSMYSKKSVDGNYTYPGGPIWDGTKLSVDKPSLSG